MRPIALAPKVLSLLAAVALVSACSPGGGGRGGGQVNCNLTPDLPICQNLDVSGDNGGGGGDATPTEDTGPDSTTNPDGGPAGCKVGDTRCNGNTLETCNGTAWLTTVQCPSGTTCDPVEGCKVGPCEPECAGVQCGPDGCGGSCGTCDSDQSCVEGTCQGSTCTPSCGGKQCGSDGCGGSCGTCAGSATCNAAGQCETTCTPSCSGKQCGSDGCGGSCGTCDGGTCTASGLCESNPCSCLGKECGDDGCGASCGQCPSGWSCNASNICQQSTCTPSCSGKQCGSDGCGGSCGTCTGGQTCNASGQCTGGSCVPNCSGAECGDDGCGGTCGTCPDGDICPSGQCSGTGTSCGSVTFEGCCTGSVLEFCDGSQLHQADCGSNGCGWNTAEGYYDCGQFGADPTGANPIQCPF